MTRTAMYITDDKDITCPRCGCHEYVDTAIHAGQSTRRDCARCHRFICWPRWYARGLGDGRARAMAMVGVAGIRLAADMASVEEVS